MPSSLILLAMLVLTGLSVAWLYGQVRGRDLHDVERWDHARVVTSAWTSGAQPNGDGAVSDQRGEKQPAEAGPRLVFLRRTFWTGHYPQVGLAASLGLVIGLVINSPATTKAHQRTSSAAVTSTTRTGRADPSPRQQPLIDQQGKDAQVTAANAAAAATVLANQAAQVQQAKFDQRQAELDTRQAELDQRRSELDRRAEAMVTREAKVLSTEAAAAATPTPVQRLAVTAPRPPGATAQCRDGSYAFSRLRSSACSGHGGAVSFYN